SPRVRHSFPTRRSSDLLAALGVSAAFFARHRGAPGQAVDVSGVCGALALNSGTFVSGAGHRGSLSLGGDPRGVYPTYGLYPTARSEEHTSELQSRGHLV